MKKAVKAGAANVVGAKLSNVRYSDLLDEAARQLNTRGLSLQSLNEVADRLGVSRGALYYYIEDRADLVYQCYRRTLHVTDRRVDEAFGAKGSALEGIIRLLDRAAEDPSSELSYISEIGYLGPAQRSDVLALYEIPVAKLKTALKTGIRAGEIRACDEDLVARTILNMASFIPFARRWSISAPDVGRSRLVTAVKMLLLDGWSLPRGRAADHRPLDLSGLAIATPQAFDRAALAAAKHETILATASRLFNLRGVDTTSLDEIAKELGATKRTLYHYVGDKPVILAACYRRSFRIYQYLLEQAVAWHASAAAALAAYHEASALAQMRPDICPLRPLDGLEGLAADDQAQIQLLAQAKAAAIRRILMRGVKDRKLRDMDIDAVALVLPGATTWLTKGLITLPPGDDKRVAAEITSVLARGIRRTP